MLAKHVTKYFGKMQLSANRLRMTIFVKIDLEAYGRVVHDRGYWLLSRHGQAPPVSEFGPPVVPVWENLISYVKAGGLINAETSTGRMASATGVASPAGAASSGTCRRWEKSGECQYGQACTFVAFHMETRKARSGAQVGAATIALGTAARAEAPRGETTNPPSQRQGMAKRKPGVQGLWPVRGALPEEAPLPK